MNRCDKQFTLEHWERFCEAQQMSTRVYQAGCAEIEADPDYWYMANLWNLWEQVKNAS